MYAPDENGLGAIRVVEDTTACRREAQASGTLNMDVYGACMIRKGYRKTAKGYSRSTGISPKAIIGVAAALAIPALLPALLPAAVGAVKAVLPAVKAIAEKGTQEAVPAGAAAPVVVSPAPATPPAIRAAALEPWIVPALMGGALVLFLALRR